MEAESYSIVKSEPTEDVSELETTYKSTVSEQSGDTKVWQI